MKINLLNKKFKTEKISNILTKISFGLNIGSLPGYFLMLLLTGNPSDTLIYWSNIYITIGIIWKIIFDSINNKFGEVYLFLISLFIFIFYIYSVSVIIFTFLIQK